MDEDKIFDALAIRDTSNHDSEKSNSGEFTAKVIIIENGLNQTVTFQLQGSRDCTVWLDIGATFDVAASTNQYETVGTYFPCYRLQAICVTAPTTGTLDTYIIKTRL